MKNDVLPLKGRVVAITRPIHQSDEMVKTIKYLGGEALLAPTIEIVSSGSEDFDTFIKEIIAQEYDYLIFLSTNGVRSLIEQAESNGSLSQLLDSMKKLNILCVGEKTQAELEAHGISGNSAQIQTTQGVIQTLGDDLTEIRIGIPRSNLADKTLRDALENKGAKVREATAYITTLPRDTSPVADLINKLNKGKVDAVIFTSSSTAKNLLTIAKNNELEPQLRQGLDNALIVAIGPRTKQTMDELGINVDIIPTQYSIKSMMDALVSKIKKV